MLLNQLYGCFASPIWHRATHHRNVAPINLENLFLSFTSLSSLLFEPLFICILWKFTGGRHLNKPAGEAAQALYNSLAMGRAAATHGHFVGLRSLVALLLLWPALYVQPIYHYYHVVTHPWSQSTSTTQKLVQAWGDRWPWLQSCKSSWLRSRTVSGQGWDQSMQVGQTDEQT